MKGSNYLQKVIHFLIHIHKVMDTNLQKKDISLRGLFVKFRLALSSFYDSLVAITEHDFEKVVTREGNKFTSR